MGNLILAVAFVLAGCGSKLPTSLDEVRPQEKVERIEGQLLTTQKATVDLSAVNEPLVLIFATFFCISCKEEAQALNAYFTIKGAHPKNVRIITVLAGGNPARAEQWAQINKVTWTMAADEDASVFQSLCSERLTPCVITQNLNSKPSIIKRIGKVPIEQLERETGPWLY